MGQIGTHCWKCNLAVGHFLGGRSLLEVGKLAGRHGSALSLEVKFVGGAFWGAGYVGGQISTHFGSKFGEDVGGGRLAAGWIGTHFGSEFGGGILGGDWICWGVNHFGSELGVGGDRDG